MIHDSSEAASPGGWARRRLSREREFLDAARELLVEEGFEAFTLQRLAAKTGSAVGAVYRYFPSKDAILVSLQEELLARLGEELAAELAVAGESPIAQLLRATEWYRRLPETRPVELRMISFAIGDPRELVSAADAGRVLARAAPLLEAIARPIAAAEGLGLLHPGPAFERAILLWASLHGVLQLGKLARAEPRIDAGRLAPILVRDLLAGWGAPRELLEDDPPMAPSPRARTPRTRKTPARSAAKRGEHR